jgi:hypothetical protein
VEYKDKDEAMMFNEITGKRIAVKTKFGNWYLFISDKDIMVTVAEENAPRQAEIRVMIEAVCRIASKGMAAGLSLSDVATQMQKADMGRASVLGKISDAITDYAESHKG